MIWNQAMLADDIWSPGSGGPVWVRITRLQSVGVKPQVRSTFVTDSCSSDDPVERLAVIAWIGRTRSEKHIPDLERLLADKISQVRQLAFEALLVLDDPLAKKLVLQTILEVDDYSDEELATPSYRRGYSGGLSSVRDNQSALTDLLKGLSLKDRKFWIEKCVDQPQWLLETQYERNDTKFDFRAVLKQSVFHRGPSLTRKQYALQRQKDRCKWSEMENQSSRGDQTIFGSHSTRDRRPSCCKVVKVNELARWKAILLCLSTDHWS